MTPLTYPHTKDWLTAPDLAREAGVSENTARRWIKQHALGRKVGGRWRADKAAVAEFAAPPLQAKTDPETTERR
jgi:transposase-like protein